MTWHFEGNVAMKNSDPFRTQRDDGDDVASELSAVGFDDAREVGRGGFGVVLRCHQSALDRVVAIKLLSGSRDDDLARFYREQRAMGQLTGHPNIVGVLAVGTTRSGRAYIVMQYHSQGSLADRIRTRGPLPVDEVLRIGIKISAALATAHQRGIVHRDVKPENILFTDFGEPALTDFGIAHTSDGFRTTVGTIACTPAYTAPEVLGGDEASAAADVYALGATLYCALTAHAPFERRSGEQLVVQVLRAATEPAPVLRGGDAPDDVSSVIEAAMRREPENRPSALMLGEMIQQVQHDHGFAVESMTTDRGSSSVKVCYSPAVSGPRNRSLGNLNLRPHNLPVELTTLVGRRTQVSQVRNMLVGSRLVTLTGPGGVGKTRIAVRVAHKVPREVADAVRLVDLSGVRDPALLVDVVATTVGIHNRGATPVIELLISFINTQRMLLVLDNCEQIIDAVAALVTDLIQTCPNLTILATSRESLGISGERVQPVPPLGYPDPIDTPSLKGLTQYDAVTLFADRAADASRSFELTEKNMLSVARICSHVDGLPLAIELAAARLRTMSPAQILQKLDDRYTLLTHGNRGAPTRQQTLRWCIDWSYNLCTPDERALWGQLAVFSGSFDIEAVEGVCRSESSILDLVTALVEKSILTREESNDSVRFRFLETVHDYGIEKLRESGEFSSVCHRHLDWYRNLALEAHRSWISGQQLEWITTLEQELTNVRGALKFSMTTPHVESLQIAAALHPFWMCGRLSEGRHWLDRALTATEHGEATPDELMYRARALHSASLLAAYQNDLPVAINRLDELQNLLARTATPMAEAMAAIAEGYVGLMGNDLPHARTALARAVEILDTESDLVLRMRARLSFGFVLVLQGDTAHGLAVLEELSAATEPRGETVFRANSLWGRGLALWTTGNLDGSAQLLEDGLRLARSAADPYTVTHCLEVLGWIAADRRDSRRAAVLMGGAEDLGRTMGFPAAWFPALAVYRDARNQQVRQDLRSPAYDAARAEGAGMDMSAIIRLALGEETRPKDSQKDSSAQLTRRERQVADLVAKGMSNKEIATRLVISQRTAKGHVEHILAKLGFTSRTQIAAQMLKQARDQT